MVSSLAWLSGDFRLPEDAAYPELRLSNTLSLAKELRPDGIRVNEIALRQADAELQSDHIAQTALFLCSSQGASVIGSVLFLDAGLRDR